MITNKCTNHEHVGVSNLYCRIYEKAGEIYADVDVTDFMCVIKYLTEHYNMKPEHADAIANNVCDVARRMLF